MMQFWKIIFSIFLPLFAVFDCLVCFCVDGTFLNLCGYCVGPYAEKDELYGLDRCLVCGGNSSCVGCDGIVNSRFRTDACGLCLPEDDSNVYPNVVDRALKNNVVALLLIGAGLSSENHKLTKRSCEVFPTQLQGTSPRILETGLEETDLELKVEVGESFGVYEIKCSGIQGKATLRVVNSLSWNTINVEPSSINVDEKSELVVKIDGNIPDEGTVWCFLRCSGASTRIQPGTILEENRVKCIFAVFRLAANCVIGVSATEEAALDETSTGGVTKFSIKSASPTVISAELNSDLAKLLIRFDENIQLTESCLNIFANSSKISLITTKCFVSGNILAVALNPEHPILYQVEIIAGNGIRRMGASDPKLSPECAPIMIPVSTQKVLAPNLSLRVPSVLCLKTEELKVESIGSQRLSYIWSIPPPAINPGKQRDNLLLWEKSRLLEKNFNTRHSDSALLEANELLADAKYSIRVRGTNALGEQQSVSSELTFSPTAPITVTVNALPAVTSILAELNITQCVDLPGGLMFRWFLNGLPVPGGGRMVLMPNLQPGSYNVSVTVFFYKTSEILAHGWVMTQVLPSEEKALLSPAKQIVGTMDTVIITAFTPYNVAADWECVDETMAPCVTPGPNASLVEKIVDNNVTVLMIPAGKLAVGRYVWKLKNLDASEAVVVVRPGIPPALTASLIPPLVNPTADLQINGDARRLDVDCTLQWSTVFRVGFNYFNLQEDVGLGDTLKILPDEPSTAELSLFVPTAQGHWGGLMAEASYMLRFSAVCPAGSAYVDIPVTVNVPPSIEPLQIFPEEGSALETEFLITGGEARDVFHDYPIQYVWSVKGVGPDIIPLHSGSSARNVQLFLPPGKILINLEVCDIHGTCSDVSTPITVVNTPTSIPAATIQKLKKEISEAILEGSTVLGLGKAVVAVKTLNTVKNAETQLQEILDTTDDAISTRTRDLKLDLAMDSKTAATCLEFLRHVLDFIQYLKPSQLTLDLIVELKDAVAVSTMSRIKRDTQVIRVKRMVAEEARTLLDVTAEVFLVQRTTENRQKLLDDVRMFMGGLCESGASSLHSKLVDMWILSKLTQRDFEKNLGPTTSARVRLYSRRNGCLVIAAFTNEVFAANPIGLLSKVYEVELVNPDGNLIPITSHDAMTDITIPLITPGKNMDCRTWSDEQWKSITLKGNKKGNVICTTRDFGYFAVVGEGITTTTVETLKINTTTELITDQSTIPTLITTEETVDANGGSDLKISSTTIPVSFDGVQFKIEEDFDAIIAGDKVKFQNNIAEQIAEILDVTLEDIRVFVQRGSILVRVYFLTSMEKNHAWGVVNELTRYVQDGTLQLSAHGKILNVPAQNLSYLILPNSDQATTIRMATFIVVAVVVFFVIVVIILAARNEPRNEFLTRAGARLDDSVPCYLNFDNDPSLEGSSASLAKYRRPFALHLEPIH